MRHGQHAAFFVKLLSIGFSPIAEIKTIINLCLLKLFIMDAQILTLERELAYFKAKSQECADIIKLLTGYVPKQCSITFSCNNNPVVSFTFGSLEMNFGLGFFMSWHSFYAQRIREHQIMLSDIQAVPDDNCD